MQRVLNTVIGLAIVVIAASVAAILYLMAGLTIWEAGWVGLAVMLAATDAAMTTIASPITVFKTRCIRRPERS
ncbi:MAG: hypothetical protein AAFX39_05030, partial [Pseudomonadota bacterium]